MCLVVPQLKTRQIETENGWFFFFFFFFYPLADDRATSRNCH